MSTAIAASSAQTGVLGNPTPLLISCLILASLGIGNLCGRWVSAPLRNQELSSAERQESFERRRVRLSLIITLLIYYAAALPIVVVHSGWSSLNAYLRAHLFDGFGCAAFLVVAWSQLNRPWSRDERGSRTAAADLLLPLSSSIIAAAAGYVAGGSPADIVIVAAWALVFTWQFWLQITRRLDSTIRKQKSSRSR
jgi:MFS family permease